MCMSQRLRERRSEGERGRDLLQMTAFKQVE